MRSHPWRPIGAMTVTALLAVAGCSSMKSTSGPGSSGAAGSSGRAHVPGKVSSADWPTFNRTSGRYGVSVSSPPMGKVRRSWTAKVDGAAYAQPLIVGSEVIIATENDTVYALSASTGKVSWRHHLASPVTGGLPCGNVLPSGITGTPAADVANGRLWVVTYTSQPTFRHTLWALNLKNGRTISQRPIDAPRSDPKAEQERGALTLLGSRVYVPFGGLFGDCSDYKGRVVAAPASGKGKLVAYATPANRAGIWAPAGESVRNGDLYVSTGNGLPANKIGDSDSVLRLGQGLSVLSRFTPSNFVSLSAHDQDLSSTTPALLPGGLIFQVGKEGVGYVLNGRKLGGTGGQLASAKLCDGGFGGDAVDGSTVVFSCFTGLHAISVKPAKKGGRPAIRKLWSASAGGDGPPIIAGGVVWEATGDGFLRGFSLTSGKRVFIAPIATSTSDFPTLAASGPRLIVTGSATVSSFVGI